MSRVKLWFVFATMAVFLIFGGVAFASEDVSIKVNGQLLKCDPSPYIESGITMVPMRLLFESLGARVEWDETTMTATASKTGAVVKFSIGGRTATVNGREEKITLPAVLVAGRTFIPLRFAASALGGNVEWDGTSSTVFVEIPPGVEEKAIQEIALEGRAVVFIKTYNKNKKPLSTGSGFITNSSGVIMTNYHVIDSAYSAEVVLNDGKSYPVKSVLNYDVNRDVAVLKIEGKSFPAVRLGSSATLAVGEEIVAIGSPQGLQNTISTGVVSTALINLFDRNFIQITAPIGPGSSGGALFNLKGEVVGITTLARREGQNINFAIPIDEARGSLKSAREITLNNLALRNETEFSYKDMANILYRYYNQPKFGDYSINFNDVWVRESVDGKTIYVGLFLDNQNYTTWLKAVIEGRNVKDMENWLKVMVDRIQTQYPDKKVFGGVQFQGWFHNYPEGFPPESINRGKDDIWLVNYTTAYFWNEFGETHVEWQ